MAKRARAIVLLAGCAAALVACNLLAGLTDDYAYNEEAGSAMTSEAGDESAVVDPDGSRSDAPGNETSVDAADGSKPTTVPFCDRVNDAGDATVVFCSDFEAPDSSTGSMPFGWTSIKYINGADASFTRDPQGGYEGAGLSVVTNKTPSGMSVAAWLEYSVTSGNPNVAAHYEAEMQVKSEASPITYTALGILTFNDLDASVREHGVAAKDTNTFVQNLSPGSVVSVNNVPPPWHHVVIRLDRPTPGAQYDRRLTIDSRSDIVTPAMSFTNTGAVKLRIGTFNTGTSPTDTGMLRARFDNVVVRQW